MSREGCRWKEGANEAVADPNKDRHATQPNSNSGSHNQSGGRLWESTRNWAGTITIQQSALSSVSRRTAIGHTDTVLYCA